MYKLQNTARERTRKIKKAKNESWQRFSESLAENKRLANKTIYKVARSMQEKDEN